MIALPHTIGIKTSLNVLMSLFCRTRSPNYIMSNRRKLLCLLLAFISSAVVTYVYMIRYDTMTMSMTVPMSMSTKHAVGVFNDYENVKSHPNVRISEDVRTASVTVTTASARTTESAATIEATVPCDNECQRFQRLMAQWPHDKPKAAFVYLAHRIDYLVLSIKSVNDFFCHKFDYPVVIFHEAGMFSSPQTKNKVLNAAAWNSSRIFFQQVKFKVPKFLSKPVLPKITCVSTIGYRHMCRFQAKGKSLMNFMGRATITKYKV